MDLFSNLPFIYEPEAYHDRSRAGYFVLVGRRRSGQRRPQAYALSALSDALADIDPNTDAWISAAEFFNWDRNPAAADAACVGSFWVVIDYRKVPAFAAWSTEMVVSKVLEECTALRIPEPTLIVASSGRIEIKWVLRRVVPSSAFLRWRAVQRVLFKKFAGFASDHGSRGVKALFRLVGSIDSASGSVVRVAHCARKASAASATMRNGLVVYDFDRFAARVLPHTREEVKAFKKRKATADAAARNSRQALKPRSPQQLVQARLDDLRTLARLRGLDNGAIPANERALMAFWGGAFLAQLVEAAELPERIAALVHELKLEWSADEAARRLNAVLERAKNVSMGNGGEGHYKPDNETLIAVLGITDDEQLKMSTIIGEQEAGRRHRERQAALRRKNGVQSRDEKQKVAGLRRGLGRAMKADGMRWSEIATALDYPSADAARIDSSRG